MSQRIAQLTDLHLFEDPRGVLAGVPTWDTFRAVLDELDSAREEVDCIVLTGDLAQDEALGTYQMLREVLDERSERYVIVPGNHDDPRKLREVFPELFPDEDGPLTFRLTLGAWRILGLDSHVPGEVKGRIEPDQIEWLRSELAAGRDHPTLLFMHHPPVPINVAWLDELGLLDRARLLTEIEAFPQVRVVCAGHVHQESVARIGNAAMYTTPSTCVQFGARAEKSFDSRAAGYRSFTLHDDGRHDTVVHRVTKSVT
jgi:Icc protein